jgi:ATP-binding cassette, subfamily B, bacterial
VSEQLTLPGLPEDVAVQRLLRKLPTLAGAMPIRNGHETGQTLLERLDGLGVHGRLARVTARDLPQVELPTLLQLEDDRWLLVTRIRWRGVVCEDAAGHEHTLPHRVVRQKFSGLVLDRTPELPAGANLRSRLLRLVWQQRRILYPAAAFALLVQALTLLAPQLTRILVDEAFHASSARLLQGIVMGMVLVALLKSWAGWLEQRCAQLLQVRLDAILERGLFAHVLRLPYRCLEGKSLGRLMQGFEGIAIARTALTGDALGVAFGGVTALASIVLMARMMPAPTVLVVAIGIVSAIVAVVAGRRQDQLQRHIVDTTVRERERAAEILTRIATLKAAGAASSAVDRWLALLTRTRLLNRRSERLTLGAQVAIDLLGQLQLQGLWIWGGLRVMAGSLGLGELLAFTMIASLFQAAIERLAHTFVKLRALKPHLIETQSLLEQKPMARTPPRTRPRSAAAIEIRDLWFRYSDDRPWVFAGLNVVVAPGETHHLSDRSGFGKTTLLKLVAGLYEPSSGSVLVGGCPPAAAREQMIYLPQHVRIFNASVRDNLRLFSAGAPFSRLMEAAELTGLARLLDDLPMGYDTLLAHGGANFSGGQRQLIALTAALASDRPILLLDEPTANLDLPAARRLLQSPLFSGRTVLHAGHGTS